MEFKNRIRFLNSFNISKNVDSKMLLNILKQDRSNIKKIKYKHSNMGSGSFGNFYIEFEYTTK